MIDVEGLTIQPLTPQEGDIWHRTADSTVVIYTQGSWMPLVDTEYFALSEKEW